MTRLPVFPCRFNLSEAMRSDRLRREDQPIDDSLLFPRSKQRLQLPEDRALFPRRCVPRAWNNVSRCTKNCAGKKAVRGRQSLFHQPWKHVREASIRTRAHPEENNSRRRGNSWKNGKLTGWLKNRPEEEPGDHRTFVPVAGPRSHRADKCGQPSGRGRRTRQHFYYTPGVSFREQWSGTHRDCVHRSAGTKAGYRRQERREMRMAAIKARDESEIRRPR